jgi:hypothetical protein
MPPNKPGHTKTRQFGGAPEETEQRAEHEQRTGEIVGRGSGEANETGTGDAHQPSGRLKHVPLARLRRTQDDAGDRQREGRVETVQRPHDEGDEARHLIERR